MIQKLNIRVETYPDKTRLVVRNEEGKIIDAADVKQGNFEFDKVLQCYFLTVNMELETQPMQLRIINTTPLKKDETLF